jgi:hypothetical protein
MSGLLTASQLTYITSIVSRSLDQSLPLYRPTKASDGYGHTTLTYPNVPTATIACTLGKPSATQLQAYANIIGTQEAMTMRFLNTTDVKEGDRVVVNGENWLVQNVENSDSYTVTFDALITVIS